MRAFLIADSIRRLAFELLGREFPKVSGLNSEYSRFLETRPGDPRINPLRGRSGSVIAAPGVAVALFTGLGSAPSTAWRGDVLMVAAALGMALHPQRRRRRRPDGATNQNVRLMRPNQVTNLSGAHSTYCRSNSRSLERNSP
jgi:hypothetical protein